MLERHNGKVCKENRENRLSRADMAWLAGLSGNWLEPAFGGHGRRSGEIPGVVAVVLMCSLFMPQQASTRSSMAGSYLRDSYRSGG